MSAVAYHQTKNIANQDINDFVFGLRPMLGLSAARLLGSENITAHLYYSYTLFLGQAKLDYINQHAITFRVFVPISAATQKVRRIVKQGIEY
jgi:hypothetical protein